MPEPCARCARGQRSSPFGACPLWLTVGLAAFAQVACPALHRPCGAYPKKARLGRLFRGRTAAMRELSSASRGPPPKDTHRLALDLRGASARGTATPRCRGARRSSTRDPVFEIEPRRKINTRRARARRPGYLSYRTASVALASEHPAPLTGLPEGREENDEHTDYGSPGSLLRDAFAHDPLRLARVRPPIHKTRQRRYLPNLHQPSRQSLAASAGDCRAREHAVVKRFIRFAPQQRLQIR